MTQPALPLPPMTPLPGEPGPGPGGTATPASPRRKGLLRLFIVAGICLVFAAAAVGSGISDYARLQEFASFRRPFLRTEYLVSLIITGASATLLLGGIINCFDRILDLSPHWSARLVLDLAKRLLLVLQLFTTTATLLAIGLLALHREIPRF